MKAFHIDMNGLLFKKEYLIQWVSKLAHIGYDTILWEVENGIQWDTCPESNDSDALSKAEFKEILDHTKSLNLLSIPLLQSIGHAEYVLKNTAYHHLAENVETFRQYCPLNPEVLRFLHNWIYEYLDLFGHDISYFHIGADEAYDLGFCPKCSAKAQNESLSALYIDHINAVIEPLVAKNITPIIWADMILNHNEVLWKLDKRILLYDWIYNVNKTTEKVKEPKGGLKDLSELSEDVKKIYGEFILPKGSDRPDPFYTSAYLTSNGFKTVICPASASHGDTVFAPGWFHLANTFDFMQKSQEKHLEGFVLTSWTVRLLPWELQNICIAMHEYLKNSPTGTFEEYQKWYTKTQFGLDEPSFWQAIQQISTPLPLALTNDIGHSKNNLATPKDAILKSIEKHITKKSKSELLENIQTQSKDYENALTTFETIKTQALLNKPELEIWILATKNLINRTQSALAILNENKAVANKLIEQTKIRKSEYQEYLKPKLQPLRLKNTVDRLFDPLIYALEKI